MKFRFLSALTIVAIVAPTLHASSNFPFITPNCNVAIVQPPNEGGYYMSDDCKQVYVLPPRQGTVIVSRVANIANQKLCPALYKAYANHQDYQDQYSNNLKKLSSNLSDKERAAVKDNLNILTDAIAHVYDNIKGVPALDAQIVYSRRSSSDWIGEYLKLNPNLGADYQIKFQPAPIAEGYLSFKAKAADGNALTLDAVVASNIAGTSPVDGNKGVLQDTVRMNGDLSGSLTLSLAGACEYLDKPKSSLQDLVTYMVANETYTVPVMTWAGYDASLDTDTAIHTLLESSQTRSQFSVNDAANLFAQGGASSSYKFTPTIMEMENSPFTQADKANFFQDLSNQVLERLSARLLDQLKATEFLDVSKDGQLAKAPEPGFVDEIHYGQSCHSSSGLFGLISEGGCSTYSYTVKIPHGSSASIVLDKVNNTNFSNSETVRMREILYRVHTSTFVSPTQL